VGEEREGKHMGEGERRQGRGERGQGGGEREGGGEDEDRKGEGNITGASLATSRRTPNRTAASYDQCQACVADIRLHTCILIIRTHTENICSSNCSQETSRSGGWE